ncbi:MAG: T9SS type A sorting domain-containing protein, partial [Bacteroidota bacterium]
DSLSLEETFFNISFLPNDPRPLQITALKDFQPELTVQTVMVEKEAILEGKTVKNIVKKFLPNPAGESVANWKVGETYTFDPIENENIISSITNNRPDDFQLIVFLQEATNKRVYQVESFPLPLVTSIKDEFSDNPSVRVFPNPASRKLFLSLPKNEKKNINIEILDLYGRVLIDQKTVTLEPIDITNLAEGVYFLSIQLNVNQQIVTPILVQR